MTAPSAACSSGAWLRFLSVVYALVPDRRPEYIDWVLNRQTATAGRLILIDLGDETAGPTPEGDAPAGADMTD